MGKKGCLGFVFVCFPQPAPKCRWFAVWVVTLEREQSVVEPLAVAPEPLLRRGAQLTTRGSGIGVPRRREHGHTQREPHDLGEANGANGRQAADAVDRAETLVWQKNGDVGAGSGEREREAGGVTCGGKTQCVRLAWIRDLA